MKQPYNTTIYNTALYLRLSRDDELQGVGLLQSGFSLAHLEYDREFHGIESFIPDAAEDVQLGVVQHGMGQAYHFAMAFAGHQDIHSHGPDVLGKRHD